jgi:hypothetical protein
MPYELRIYRQPHRAWAVPRRLATLQEARLEALGLIVDSHDAGDAAEWEQLEIRAQRIPPGGGKLGPLPDGYIIEVNAIPDGDLWARAPHTDR